MSHTLLLADDNATTHRLIELTLAEQGVRVVSVTDGRQAVEWLRSERPDIVLADINLPRVDGYQLASYITGEPSLSGLPVLLITGAFDTVDEGRVRESGASGVLVKPFEPGLVINRVKELLGLGKADRPPVAPQGPGRLVPPNDTPEPRPLAGPGIGPSSASPPRPVQAPTNRLTPPPSRPAEPPLPPPREDARADGPAAWDQLREETGLGPDAQHVEGESGGADYFDRLDAAFDSLDAQLAGRTAPHGRRAPAPPAARMPAANDPGPRATSRQVESEASPAPAGAPVFEVDDGWFDGERETAATPVPVAAAPAEALPAGYGEVAPERPSTGAVWPEGFEDRAPFISQPAYEPPSPAAHHTAEAPYAPYAPQSPDAAQVSGDPQSPYAAQPPVDPESPYAAQAPVVPQAPFDPQALPPFDSLALAQGRPYELQPQVPYATYAAQAPLGSVADAFDLLLAAEQGEPTLTPIPALTLTPQMPAFEISDEVIERIASRVAQRLSEGLLIEQVTRIVGEVSERLVRDEIGRIKAAAQAKKP